MTGRRSKHLGEHMTIETLAARSAARAEKRDMTDRIQATLEQYLSGRLSRQEIDHLRTKLLAERLAPADDAPGDPGPPVKPDPIKPGPTTSEYSWSSWAVWAGAGLVGLFAILSILSAFGFRADLGYLSQLVEVFQTMAAVVGAYAVSRGLAKR